MAPMRLILIRHGQNPRQRRLHHAHHPAGPGLNALGRQQAAAIPAALSDKKIDAFYASTHVRTQLTATPLAKIRGLRIQVRDGIREVSAGRWEGASDHASHMAFLNLVFGWPTDSMTRVPEGESGHEVLERFDAVVHEAVHSGRRVSRDGQSRGGHSRLARDPRVMSPPTA